LLQDADNSEGVEEGTDGELLDVMKIFGIDHEQIEDNAADSA
jgi:hypothetical protein